MVAPTDGALHALEAANRLYERGDIEGALTAVNAVLNDHPDDWRALYFAGQIFSRFEKYGLAKACFEKSLSINEASDTYNAIGQAEANRGGYDKAEPWYRKALNVNGRNAHALSNLGLVRATQGKPTEAEALLRKALKIAPDLRAAKDNLSLALLALGQWREGWEMYESSVGSEDRKEIDYGCPAWDGSPIKTLIVYGDQGIGDEVMFASCVPDARKRVERLIIDTEPRLVGLLSRSFPDCEVYGTRYSRESAWLEGVQPDAKVIVSGLPRFFRNADREFPGAPYLTACPERRRMTRALLDGLGPKKKIGIAWSGGSKMTGAEWRSVELGAFKPLFDAVDVHWVSLQWKGAPEAEKHGVKHFPFVTEVRDYDMTAALVAELDGVVTVTTSVVHLSAGLGQKTCVLVADRPSWRYARKPYPWAKSVTLTRLGRWQEAIDWATATI